MTRAAALVFALAVAALLGAADGTAVQAQTPKLFGTVGPEFTIVLRDAQGTRVTTIEPGTYDVVVDDRSPEHNFHLSGPGVDRRTDVEFTGTTTWTVTFGDGNYQYVCDPHATSMRDTLVSGTPPVVKPTATPTPAPVTAKSKLVLSAGPGFVISLKTAAGKAVQTMKTGTYTVSVRDRSRLHNAHIVAPGYNRKTTLPFVGAQTWKIALARTGTLRFLCDPHASSGMRGSAKVIR